jgi:hypothetical protein
MVYKLVNIKPNNIAIISGILTFSDYHLGLYISSVEA